MSCSVPRLRGHHLRPLSLNLGPVFQGTFRFFCAALHVIQIAQLRIGGPQVPPVSLNLDLAHANLENNVYGSGEYFAFDARLARYFQRQTRNKDRRSLEAHETWAICALALMSDGEYAVMQADVTKRFDTQLAFFGKTILSATGDLFKHTYTWLGRSVPPGRADIVRKGSHSKRLAN